MMQVVENDNLYIHVKLEIPELPNHLDLNEGELIINKCELATSTYT